MKSSPWGSSPNEAMCRGCFVASMSSPLATSLPSCGSQTPDPAGLVVAVDVDADQLGQGLAAVDVAPGDAQTVVLAVGRGGVGILDDRGTDLAGAVGPLPALGLEGVEALADAPAVIAPVLDAMDLEPNQSCGF